MKALLCVTLFLMLSSCEAEYTPPHALYKAQFDVSKVDDVERAVLDIADRWELRAFQKDREQMKFLTQNKEAFFIALYFDKDPVLVINNVGVGEILTLETIDYKNMPIQDLEKLTTEVIDTLESRFDLEFEEETPTVTNAEN